MLLTWDHELLIEFTTEDFLGDKLETLHCILDNLVIPLLVQTKFIDKELLENAVQESTTTDTTGAHCGLLDLQDGFQRGHSIRDEIDGASAGITKDLSRFLSQHGCAKRLRRLVWMTRDLRLVVHLEETDCNVNRQR